MSSPRRRKELALIRDREYQQRQIEDARKAARTMWEQIEEADTSVDVKEILHAFAEKLGLEVMS